MTYPTDKQKNRGEELRKCLEYYVAEAKILIFQEKEAALFENTLGQYGKYVTKDNNAAKEVHRAAVRLAQAARETVNRQEQIASVPPSAITTHSAWQLAFSNYSSWASAQAQAMEAMVDGREPAGKQVQQLRDQFENSLRQAEKEEKNLLKSMGVREAELQAILKSASEAIATDDWQPEETGDTQKRTSFFKRLFGGGNKE